MPSARDVTARFPTRLPTARRVVGTVTLLAVAVTWFVLLRPAAFGGPLTLLRVTGESMEPGMREGDLAIVSSVGGFSIGDVVAYRVPDASGAPGPHVIHRLVAQDGSQLTMRGDNNSFDDPWEIEAQDVVGRLWWHIPEAGRLIAHAADPVVLGGLAAVVTTFLVMIGSPPRNVGSAPRNTPPDRREGSR